MYDIEKGLEEDPTAGGGFSHDEYGFDSHFGDDMYLILTERSGGSTGSSGGSGGHGGHGGHGGSTSRPAGWGGLSNLMLKDLFPGGPEIEAPTPDMLNQAAADSEGKYVKVDRGRLGECLEAWVYVIVESPMSPDPMETPEFFGGWCGFGPARAVLTWPNSD